MSKVLKEAGPTTSVAYTLIGSITFLGLVGYMLDKYLATDPWLLLAGLSSGLMVGFYELFKLIFRKNKK